MDQAIIERETGQDIPVLACNVEDCSYNRGETCHAPAIAVGDVHPACDTFTVGPASIRPDEARVARCAVDECLFNADAHCHADGVTVDYHSAHADCVTFEGRA